MSILTTALNRPFQLLDAFGRRYRVQLKTALPAIFSMTSLLFFGVLLLVLWISDPVDYHDYISAPAALLLWAAGLAIALFTYVGLIFLWSMSAVSRSITLPISAVGLVAFLLSTVFHKVTGSLLSQGLWEQELFPSHIYLLLTQIGFEALYLRYGLPKSFQDIAARKAGDAYDRTAVPLQTETTYETHDNSVTFAGEQAIPLNEIWLVRALEHYVEIHGRSGEPRVVRARITDFLEQVSEADGIQTHRSWWVSASAAKELVTEGGKRFLALQDGQKIPVSRGRHPDVSAWLGKL
ncbi:LytTR family DNA-binding domain-containing protein [Donghicola sp. XS_ASV15]|uniref:LytTR family DNA-binding domain-containing protein n=1 Tax=Donghicola sp. XS_ASV15 TaxID=3241295 RepID=UPI003512B68F